MKHTVSHKIQYYNYIFTLGMVLYHTYKVWQYNITYTSEKCGLIFSLWTKFCMHIGYVSLCFFFMMSGFLAYYNMKTVSDAVNKIKRRFKSLIVPFFTWNVFTLLFHRFYYGVKNITSIEDILRLFFTNPYVGALWYLLAIMILMLLAPIFIWIKNKNHKIMALILMVLGIVTRIMPIFVSNFPHPLGWWWYGNAIGYMPVYLLGVFLGMFCSEKIVHEDYNLRIASLIGILLLVLACVLWLKTDWILWKTYSVIEIIGLWLVLKSEVFSRKVLVLEASLFTYALHQTTLTQIINKYFKFNYGIGHMSLYKYIYLCVLAVFLIALISFNLQQIFKCILPKKIYECFTGGR